MQLFEMLVRSSRELATRFQMILGTPRLRPKVITTNMPHKVLDHLDRGWSEVASIQVL